MPVSKAGPRTGRTKPQMGADKRDVAGVEKKRQPRPQGGADKRDVAGVSQRGRVTSPVTKKAPAKKAASNKTPGVLPRMGVKAEGKVGTGIRATEWAYRKAARAGKMRKAGKNAATNRVQGQIEKKAGRGKVR